MPFQHRELAAGRWFTLPLIEQMTHVGSEVERALRWRERDDRETSQFAFERALELIDLTLADRRHRHRLKEISRIRELLVDYFAGRNEYHTTPDSLSRYFLTFAYAVRLRQGH